ncbi:spore germination protein [Tigheibacillus jepli]
MAAIKASLPTHPHHLPDNFKDGVKKMPVSVNIYLFKVFNMTNNASIVLGTGFHNSHSSQTQSKGNLTAIGDQNDVVPEVNNMIHDEDLLDQNEIGNSDNMKFSPGCAMENQQRGGEQ